MNKFSQSVAEARPAKNRSFPGLQDARNTAENGGTKVCSHILLKTPPKTPSTKPKTSPSKGSWRHLKPAHKAILCTGAMLKSNTPPWAVTINLDKSVIQAARESHQGPRKHLLDRVNKHIGAASSCWIAIFENNHKDDGFHIHLVVDGTADHSALKKASQKVAGPFARNPSDPATAGRHAIHCVRCNPARTFKGYRGALGWMRYLCKQLDDPPFPSPVMLSHRATKIAKDFHETRRAPRTRE